MGCVCVCGVLKPGINQTEGAGSSFNMTCEDKKLCFIEKFLPLERFCLPLANAHLTSSNHLGLSPQREWSLQVVRAYVNIFRFLSTLGIKKPFS